MYALSEGMICGMVLQNIFFKACSLKPIAWGGTLSSEQSLPQPSPLALLENLQSKRNEARCAGCGVSIPSAASDETQSRCCALACAFYSRDVRSEGGVHEANPEQDHPGAHGDEERIGLDHAKSSQKRTVVSESYACLSSLRWSRARAQRIQRNHRIGPRKRKGGTTHRDVANPRLVEVVAALKARSILEHRHGACLCHRPV